MRHGGIRLLTSADTGRPRSRPCRSRGNETLISFCERPAPTAVRRVVKPRFNLTRLEPGRPARLRPRFAWEGLESRYLDSYKGGAVRWPMSFSAPRGSAFTRFGRRATGGPRKRGTPNSVSKPSYSRFEEFFKQALRCGVTGATRWRRAGRRIAIRVGTRRGRRGSLPGRGRPRRRGGSGGWVCRRWGRCRWFRGGVPG